MMENKIDFFLSLTKRVFSNWTGLKLAVENGMGSKYNANEFCECITNFMLMNEGLCSNEIQWILEDYMDDVFNTELEDFSCQQVADELFRFYHYYMEGNETQAVLEFEKLPPLQPWIVLNLVNKMNKQPIAVESSSDSEDDEKEENMDTEVSEWTEVKSRRKK